MFCGGNINDRRSHARAFTLVEIVVVLLVMSVMLTMTAVALTGGLAGVAARESAIRLRNSLRYAHQYAVIHGCPCRVGIAHDQGWYELTCRPDPDQELYIPMPGGRVGRLASRVHFGAVEVQARPEAGGASQSGSANQTGDESETAAVITFDATGQCDAARIELTDGQAFYTITVSPYSGLVRLHLGPASEVPSDREDLDG